jgi:hypothetical protein
LKRIISILLALVFIYNATGYYLTFLVQRNKIKKEIKRQIKNSVPDNSLTRISFSVSSPGPEWTDENEFLWHGMMYDVVRTEIKNGNITYWCINDRQEEKLFAGLTDHINRHMKDQSSDKNKPQFNKAVIDLFFSQLNILSHPESKYRTLPFFSSNLAKGFINIPALPPKG